MATLRVILGLLLMSTSVLAADMRSSSVGDGSMEVRLGFGLLNGQSDEFVYDADGSASGIAGYKISELNWMLENVQMAGVGFTYSTNRKTRFNLDYWLNTSEDGGTMDDYDWLYVGVDWSHWSHHPDTKVKSVEFIDLNGEYTFSRENKRGQRSSWAGVLGYRRDFFKWQARGGDGIYSSAPPNYRDLYVSFPDTPGITYQQTFTTPYLGLLYRMSGRSKSSKHETRFGMYYSAWADGEDVDIHHLRDLRFEEKGSGGNWFKYELEMVFETTKQTTFTIGYSTQTYMEIKASTTVTDLISGVTYHYPGDAGGLSNKSNLISIGMEYRF